MSRESVPVYLKRDRWGRYWSWPRQAWSPNLFAMLPFMIVIAVAFDSFLPVPYLLRALVGLVTNIAIALGRLWVWRRRHPLITAEEYVRRMRASAPWN